MWAKFFQVVHVALSCLYCFAYDYYVYVASPRSLNNATCKSRASEQIWTPALVGAGIALTARSVNLSVDARVWNGAKYKVFMQKEVLVLLRH